MLGTNWGLKNRMSGLMVVGLTILAGCAIAPKHEKEKTTEHKTTASSTSTDSAASQSSDSSLGQTVTNEGSVTVATPEVQTRTIMKRSEIPTVKSASSKADINRMEPKHFVALGFPQGTADNIVRHRDQNGKFNAVDDLRNVQGMDPGLLDQMKDKLGTATS